MNFQPIDLAITFVTLSFVAFQLGRVWELTCQIRANQRRLDTITRG